MINALRASGFKDVDGAHDVNLGTQRGIIAAKGYLQSGQVNNMRDVMFSKDIAYLFGIGKVTLHKGNGGLFFFR